MEIKKQHFVKSYQFWLFSLIFWFIFIGYEKGQPLAVSLIGVLVSAFVMFILFSIPVFIKRKFFSNK